MWNKWLIIELVIISRDEVKKTVVSFKDMWTRFSACFQKTDRVFVPLLPPMTHELSQFCLQCVLWYVVNTLIHIIQDFLMADKIQSP